MREPTGRSCPVCGESIDWRPKQAKFCSRSCSDKSRYSPPPPRKKGVCKYCKGEFTGTARKKFCSKRCGELYRQPPAARQPKVCDQCGEPYVGISRQRFCSDDCRWAYKRQRTQYQGEDWLDGKKLIDWLEERLPEESLARARQIDTGLARRWTDWKKGKAADVYTVDGYLVRHFYIYLWEIPEELFLAYNPRGQKVPA